MPAILAILGILVAALGAGLALRIARGDANGRLDRRARMRIRRRVEAIEGAAHVTGLPFERVPPAFVADVSAPTSSPVPLRADPPPAAATPRRRLWRDASVVLVGFGAGLVVLLATGFMQVPGGAVLDVTATPMASPELRTAVVGVGGATSTVATAVSPAPIESPAASLEPPTPRPAAAPTERPDRTPSADRLAVLTQCPDQPECYLYKIRAGDNLQSIASWFGVSYTTVLRMNPDIGDPSQVHAGLQIHLPTPQR